MVSLHISYPFFIILKKKKHASNEIGSFRPCINYVSDRLKKEGFNHDGIQLSFKNHGFRINLKQLTNKHVTVYGQTAMGRGMVYTDV